MGGRKHPSEKKNKYLQDFDILIRQNTASVHSRLILKIQAIPCSLSEIHLVHYRNDFAGFVFHGCSFFVVSLFKLSILMCGKRHRNRAHLAIAAFFSTNIVVVCISVSFVGAFFSLRSLSLSLAHAKRVWNIRTSIFHYCVFGIQFNTQSYNVYIWAWMPCENDGKHTKNRYHKNLKGKTKYINMYTNTSKATDTRVFRMPDKREPILAKIYTIFCLTHGSTVNTFY